MKVTCLTALRKIEIREAPEPKLTNPRDVLLRIGTVGVCGSDAHYYTAGRIGSMAVEYPFVIGHECAGTLVEVGTEVRDLKVGQRVVIDPLVSCGRCDQCQAGRRHTCRHQGFLGAPGQLSGALAEFLVMPAECCFPIPDSMTLSEATVVEPLSIGLYARQMARAGPGAKMAILGTGPIGLCVALACYEAGVRTIYATDLLDGRLEIARRCGAAWTGNPQQMDVVAVFKELEPTGLDLVFECAGQQDTIDQGVELLKPGGSLLIVGIPEVDRVSFSIHTLRRKELRVENVRRQNQCMAPAIELAARGAVNLRPLVTHHFSLAESQAAFDLVAGYRDGVVKAMIHVSPEP